MNVREYPTSSEMFSKVASDEFFSMFWVIDDVLITLHSNVILVLGRRSPN